MSDYTKDQNPIYIYKALEVLADKLPESLVGSEIPESDYVDTLNKHAFADAENRLFPCYDEISTFLSACNIYGKNISNATVVETLEKRAAFLGMSEVVEDVKNVFAPTITKQASNRPEYALVIEENGTETGYLPVRDILELDTTCRDWKSARDMARIPSDLLKQAAEVIVEAATSLNALDSIPTIIKEAAENKLPDFSRIEKQIEFRINSVEDDESKELYIKMASAASQENIQEWIETVDLLDHSLLTPQIRKNDLYKTASEIIFSGTPLKEIEKVANSHISVDFDGNTVLVPFDVLKSFPDEDLFKFYPKDSAELLKQAKYAENTAIATSLFDKLDKQDKMDFLSDLKDRV